MRINIYSQELTTEVTLVSTVADTGIPYAGVRFMLHSSPMLHNRAADDDRSAVTFWLPRSRSRREELAVSLEKAAFLVRSAAMEEHA